MLDMTYWHDELYAFTEEIDSELFDVSECTQWCFGGYGVYGV